MKQLLIITLIIPFIGCGQSYSMDSIIKSKISHNLENPVYSILIHIEDINKGTIYSKAFGKLDEKLSKVSINDQFRTASTTKLFVSTIVLQLVEEGKLNLNDKASLYLNSVDYLDFNNFHNYRGKSYANDITIEQLLSHRSGLADIYNDKADEFFNLLLQNPDKQYSPKSIVELYHLYNLNKDPHFEPNNGWYYSDMNYLLIGLIIEHIEGTTLSEAIRQRILEPLKMEDTYFEFYEEHKQNHNLVHQYVGNVNFTKINTSFDWSGGGLVSNNHDLATFIKALFNLQLINKNSLEKMIDTKPTITGENKYGLGVYESKYNGHTFYGHYGFYGTYVGYCPETKTVLSYAINQAKTSFNQYTFINEVMRQFDKNIASD